MKLLITGAAGNLGTMLAKHMLNKPFEKLRLMVHETDVDDELKTSNKTEIVRADLAKKDTLLNAVKGIDTIVHFAGVLFKAGPEKFLPVTNIQYFKNLVDAAISQGVKKIVLISFPHVEGPSSLQNPAKGSLDGKPISVHAKTRLEEEKYLFENVHTPVSLRVGMVYGKGVLMIEAARWLSQRWLLSIWKERTRIHLISKDDFCSAAANAILKQDVKGIYHVGDDGDVSLQEFLSIACKTWGTHRPWQMPLWMIYFAADMCELFSKVFDTTSPLTRDFIDIGRVSYYGDTSRMKKDLLPVLKYPSIFEGKGILLGDSDE